MSADVVAAAALALVAVDECDGDAAEAIAGLQEQGGLDPSERAMANLAIKIIREREAE